MKKEFMLYVRNKGNAKKTMPEDVHPAFVKKCEVYINKLKADGNLVAAQPLARDGFIITKNANGWSQAPVEDSGLVNVGYYHISAKDMEEAIELAKGNPEFEYVPSASIEVKSIKQKEEKTDFVYPK
jgi:hypothetical protein